MKIKLTPPFIDLKQRAASTNGLLQVWEERGVLYGEKYECGLPWIHSPDSDRMLPACMLHDDIYLYHGQGEDDLALELMRPFGFTEVTRLNADRCFLRKMDEIAGCSFLLDVEKWTYFGLVRMIGWTVW